MTADRQSDLNQQALGIAVTTRQFQMQSFRSSTGDWIPMENGAASHVWRPRATAVDAVAKCLAWTGFLGIPAMQVINLQTNEVVWRCSDRYPQAGASIPLPAADERLAWQQATTEIAEPTPHRSGDADRAPLQTSLFPLPGRDD